MRILYFVRPLPLALMRVTVMVYRQNSLGGSWKQLCGWAAFFLKSGICSKMYTQSCCEDELLRRLSMSRRRLGQISYILLKTLSTSKVKNQCCVQIDSVHLYEGNLENLPELTVKPETHAQKQLFSLRKATLASSNRDKVSERPTVRFSAESNFIHKMAASAVLHGLDGTCINEKLQREACVRWDLHASSQKTRSRQKHSTVAKASHLVVVTFGVPSV